MNLTNLQRILSDLFLGPVRYFDSIGSTNAEAARWAEEGAPDLALIVADEQTAGRGRMGRRWYTPPGAALAFSLILRPEHLPILSAKQADLSLAVLTRLVALGALAVCDGLEAYAHARSSSLQPQIKWPNDVLVGGRKLAGVLVESHWKGDRMLALTLGIGINVAPLSIPPEDELTFPATCVEAILGKAVDRWSLLRHVLTALLYWRNKLADQAFIQAWESRLAYKGQTVTITALVSGDAREEHLEGEILGLNPSGALRLRDSLGDVVTLQSGEVHLRPVDRSKK